MEIKAPNFGGFCILNKDVQYGLKYILKKSKKVIDKSCRILYTFNCGEIEPLLVLYTV